MSTHLAPPELELRIGLSSCGIASGAEAVRDALLAAAGPELEGGLPAAAFLEQLGGEPASAREALELAASVEAQAFDLYSRMAERSEAAETKTLYATLIQEEKAHLRAVAALLSRLPNA